MSSFFPSCAVLIATHNGEKWLPEQLSSIRAQKCIDLFIIASDDHSTDSTLRILKESSLSFPLLILPSKFERFGNANKNFLRLICDADIGKAEYIALADQDDIWRPEKLSRAINKLRTEGAVGYSSDFEAFWQDGRRRIIKKSHSQKQFDYLFSSPGPGCTFVFNREYFLQMRAWVMANLEILSTLWVHDWILYAYARSCGYTWLIDSAPNILYRQHTSNEIGVNLGLKAMLRRLSLVKDGRYRRDILTMATLINVDSECVSALRRFKWSDRLWLILHAAKFRRSLSEVWALRLIFVLMPTAPIPRLS